MARHHHHHQRRDHGLSFLSSGNSASNLEIPSSFSLQQVLDAPIAQAKSLLKRAPPGVSDPSTSGGSSSSSGGGSGGFGGSDSSGSGGGSSGGSSGSSGSDSSSSSSSSDSGGFGVGDGWSQRKQSSTSHGPNISIPVTCGVVIPVLLAVVLFFFLHRRHVRRLKQEDANDPHKSLDFGWFPSETATGKKRGRGKKGNPEMTVTDMGLEKGPRRDRGLSMDMNLGSPYLIPPAMHGSRESLNSMSKTINSQDDRYRPAASSFLNDTSSMRSHNTRTPYDEKSSTDRSPSALRGDEDKHNLLKNSQRMSQSAPQVVQSAIPEIQEPIASKEVSRKPLPSQPNAVSNSALMPQQPELETRDSYQPNEHNRSSNNYLGAFIHSRDPSIEPKAPDTGNSLEATPLGTPSTVPPSPPAKDDQQFAAFPAPPSLNVPTDKSHPSRQQSLVSSQHASIEQPIHHDGSDYGDGFTVTPASPSSDQDSYYNNRGSSQEYMPPIDEYAYGMDEGDLGYDVHRLSMGIRPLPPDDPSDNPEQRANRIRSFYKEYFDDSKPDPYGAEYYEDYDEGYLGDGAIFDPVSGQFLTAPPRHPGESYGRRAMTPPPRGARRHGPTMSANGHLAPPRGRAFSTASGGRGPRRPPPKKKLPPPSPLRVLPTPHMLKEDAFALPIDFAPGASARQRQAGIPDSPRGGSRPFSPAVRAHTPLARSYDDLTVMPSPHLLRRSGTFTALDFAPPPRFKNSEAGSDAGSIRSNRSGMSSRTQHAVRAGAYRVSRIPKEMVGTKMDLQQALKPSWNLHNNTSTTGLTL